MCVNTALRVKDQKDPEELPWSVVLHCPMAVTLPSLLATTLVLVQAPSVAVVPILALSPLLATPLVLATSPWVQGNLALLLVAPLFFKALLPPW